jgi:phosphatidylinositol-3,4,5-trisphosphate 3-phosphatase and dual-specificity protein phosphatase PTEN
MHEHFMTSRWKNIHFINSYLFKDRLFTLYVISECCDVVALVYQFLLWLETKLLWNFIQRKLPSPGFQIEVVLVDYDGSQPAKPKPGAGPAADKSHADSSASTVAKENSAAPEESNKGTGSNNDRDEVFSDSDGEDGSSNGRKEKTAGGGQSSVNAAKPSQTGNMEEAAASAAASRLDKVAISSEQGTTKAPDGTSLKTEVSSKASSTTAPPPPAADSSSMSEFKAIAADASVFSFGDEDDYESE